MKNLKELTQARTWWRAVLITWRAGLEALEEKETLEGLKARKLQLEGENLELARLVHDYETKLHGLVRSNEDFKKQNQELEWGYRALHKENHWLKEEIFKLQGRPFP